MQYCSFFTSGKTSHIKSAKDNLYSVIKSKMSSRFGPLAFLVRR